MQIPQEVWGPGGHARQDGAPPGLRQLHRARDARGAGEDDVIRTSNEPSRRLHEIIQLR